MLDSSTLAINPLLLLLQLLVQLLLPSSGLIFNVNAMPLQSNAIDGANQRRKKQPGSLFHAIHKFGEKSRFFHFSIPFNTRQPVIPR